MGGCGGKFERWEGVEESVRDGRVLREVCRGGEVWGEEVVVCSSRLYIKGVSPHSMILSCSLNSRRELNPSLSTTRRSFWWS